MKVKELAAKFLEDAKKDEKEAFSNLMKDFLDTISVLIKARGRTDKVMRGILTELDQKWQALCKELPNTFNPDGFKLFMFQVAPEVTLLCPDFKKAVLHEPKP